MVALLWIHSGFFSHSNQHCWSCDHTHTITWSRGLIYSKRMHFDKTSLKNATAKNIPKCNKKTAQLYWKTAQLATLHSIKLRGYRYQQSHLAALSAKIPAFNNNMR